MGMYLGGQKISPIIKVGEINNQDKTITENGIYTADAGYTGLGEVTVSVSTEWRPNPDWWDIKSILQADTRDYAGKVIILYNNADDFTNIVISSPIVAVATSDGSFYTTTTKHVWDRSKDKIVNSSNNTIPQYSTRYMILYFNTSNVYYAALLNEYRYCSLYAIFGCNLIQDPLEPSPSNRFFYINYTLQSFDFLTGYNLNSWTNFDSFCMLCYSLQKLPDNLDVSNGTTFKQFCASCFSLQKLPDNLDVSNGTIFTNFCQNCSSLVELPDGLDVSSGTTFNYFCAGCYSLQKLPDNLDVSSGTSFNYFCQNCFSLVELPDGLDFSNSQNNLSSVCRGSLALFKANIKINNMSTSLFREPESNKYTLVSVQSFKYIADNAPQVTEGTTLTIRPATLERIGGLDGEIAQIFINKGWTVRGQ